MRFRIFSTKEVMRKLLKASLKELLAEEKLNKAGVSFDQARANYYLDAVLDIAGIPEDTTAEKLDVTTDEVPDSLFCRDSWGYDFAEIECEAVKGKEITDTDLDNFIDKVLKDSKEYIK